MFTKLAAISDRSVAGMAFASSHRRDSLLFGRFDGEAGRRADGRLQTHAGHGRLLNELETRCGMESAGAGKFTLAFAQSGRKLPQIARGNR